MQQKLLVEFSYNPYIDSLLKALYYNLKLRAQVALKQRLEKE